MQFSPFAKSSQTWESNIKKCPVPASSVKSLIRWIFLATKNQSGRKTTTPNGHDTQKLITLVNDFPQFCDHFQGFQNGAGRRLGDAWAAFPNPAGTKAIDVAVGTAFTCILFDDKRVRCIGVNDSGQLGFDSDQHPSSANNRFGSWGSSADMNNLQAVPLSNDLSGLYPVSMQATKVNACALMNTGAIKCWGDNSMGQLGHDDVSGYPNGTHYPEVIRWILTKANN